MFDKLLDLLVQGWAWIRPWAIIDVYEKAGILRLGQFNRKVGPGFHWKWPFLENAVEITAVETTWRSIAQPLTTKDGVTVAISTVVRYEVEDVEPYITLIYDQHDVLADRTMGLVRRHVAKNTYDQLLANEEPEKEIATLLRRAVHKYGFKIHDVTFTSFTRARPIMWITQSTAASLDN